MGLVIDRVRLKRGGWLSVAWPARDSWRVDGWMGVSWRVYGVGGLGVLDWGWWSGGGHAAKVVVYARKLLIWRSGEGNEVSICGEERNDD